MDYEKYLKGWVDGISSEIEFWDGYMRDKGGAYAEGFEKNVMKNKPFALEDDIPQGMKQCNFIDVGSGPFSRCGRITDKTDLLVTCIDPLGGGYSILKEKYALQNGVDVKTGFAEFLSKQFPENSFDIVHMSNSLDHSFDAVFAVWNLLYICKIGGKVILRHHENEAENENYQGFHQWNLSLYKKEGDFIIWNKFEEINISDLLKDYCDIELTADVREDPKYSAGKWIYNKVVLTKKKQVIVPEKPYYNQMLLVVQDKLLAETYKNLLCKAELESLRKKSEKVSLPRRCARKCKRVAKRILGKN